MDALLLFASIVAAAELPANGWESPGVLLLKLLAVLSLVLLNGFFVVSKFAIFKARMRQLDALAGEKSRAAKPARKIVENLDAYLSATQLGVALVSGG